MGTFTEWQVARMNDGHEHVWATVSDTTVDRGATYCRECQCETAPTGHRGMGWCAK